MNVPRFALTVLALLAASGCASYLANRADVAQRVEHMMGEHEYAAALSTIDLVRPTHPEYRRLRTWRGTIEKHADEWEAQIIYESEQMIDAGQWYNAQRRLDEGLKKLGQREELQAAYSRFLARRERYLASVNLELLLARGTGLPAEIAALEKLAAVQPQDAALAAELESRRSALREAHGGLLECGKAAAAAGQSERAVQCLRTALAIQADPEAEQLLAAVRKSLSTQTRRDRVAERRREERNEERNQERRIDELQVSYRSALRSGDLKTARSGLDELLALAPSEALKKESATLDEQIRLRVDRGLEDGRRLYTSGDISGARAAWVAVLGLDPGNAELQNNIARADRVLKKLEKLSTDQQNTN